jgi:hypothetical protein
MHVGRFVRLVTVEIKSIRPRPQNSWHRCARILLPPFRLSPLVRRSQIPKSGLPGYFRSSPRRVAHPAPSTHVTILSGCPMLPSVGGVGIFVLDTRELTFSGWWPIFACRWQMWGGAKALHSIPLLQWVFDSFIIHNTRVFPNRDSQVTFVSSPHRFCVILTPHLLYP